MKCVCVREREKKEREKDRDTERQILGTVQCHDSTDILIYTIHNRITKYYEKDR